MIRNFALNKTDRKKNCTADCRPTFRENQTLSAFLIRTDQVEDTVAANAFRCTFWEPVRELELVLYARDFASGR